MGWAPLHRSSGLKAGAPAVHFEEEEPFEPVPVLKIGKHQPCIMIQGGWGAISGPNLAGRSPMRRSGTIARSDWHANPSFNGRNYFEANHLAVKEGIQEARKIAGPEGVIAVNCMVALTDYDRHVKSACEGGVDVIISGAGLPLRLPEYAKEYPDVALVPIVSTVKAASLISRRWEKTYGRLPDGFVVETPKYAGGHLGVTKMDQVDDDEFSLEKVVPELVEFVEKEMGKDGPVIAAGGIWDRKDLERAFGLGAKGVQMGTRFACTFEGDASERFKQAYIDAREEDVVIIQSPAGLPGRALRSPFIDQYLKGHVESKPCIANCLTHCRYKTERETFCIAQALIDAYRGNWEEGLSSAPHVPLYRDPGALESKCRSSSGEDAGRK